MTTPPGLRALARRFFSASALGALAVAAASGAASARLFHPPVTLDTSRFPRQTLSPGGIIASLKIHTVASSVDPLNGDQNPYGIAVAPISKGVVKAGDVFVCNFNNNNNLDNIQGLGTTVVVIDPSAASPRATRYLQDERITGCNSLSIDGQDNLYAANLYANLAWEFPGGNPSLGTMFDPPGVLFTGPWSIQYTGQPVPGGTVEFFTGGAFDGGLWKVTYNTASHSYQYVEICNTFFTNHQLPPFTLAPSGLSFDASTHTLYVLEGYSNSLIAITFPGNIPAGGLIRTPGGFIGPYAASAKVIAQGGYINAPISTTVLYNHHILVENTGDNEILEFGPDGSYYGKLLSDTGGPGANFGITATGTSLSTLKVYLNDDNTNFLNYLASK